eukprot:TRINITY_DN11449_c0_g1_i7.p1 TRINITY_DN11449_c0_g1~~TRINITY_DN11449_c0_g1_i7.p1  ORF type:complete len:148 (-),score=38.38 TRINITY_DN11449_c0_g1_i7:49-492(-)
MCIRDRYQRRVHGYRELTEKLLEINNPAAETISELMDRHNSEFKQMFKPIVDSGNRTCIKSEAKEKAAQGKGSENMNIHNVSKKASAENKAAFIAEKGAVEEDTDGKRTEEKHFAVKPIDFDTAPHYKNSKTTEPKSTGQSKIARLV